MVTKSKTEEPAKAGNNESENNAITFTGIPTLPGDPGTMSFAQLDEIVRRGELVFVAVGLALAEIKKRALWKENHKTWPDYCEARLGSSVSKANRLIKSAEVMAELTPIGVNLLPTCESQIRPLAKLEAAEDRQAVWTNLISDASDQPTAEQVKDAVEKFLADEDEDKCEVDGEDPGSEDEAGDAAEANADHGAGAMGDADAAVDPDSADDHPDPEDDAEPEPEGDLNPEAEESEPFQLSDGTEYHVPGWTDGLLDRPAIKKGFGLIEKHYKRTPDSAVPGEKLLLELASKTNAETAGLEKEQAARDTALACQTLLKLVS